MSDNCLSLVVVTNILCHEERKSPSADEETGLRPLLCDWQEEKKRSWVHNYDMVQAQNTEPRYSRSLSHPEWKWQDEADPATQRSLVAESVPKTIPREAESRSEGRSALEIP